MANFASCNLRRFWFTPCWFKQILVYSLSYHRFCTVKIHEAPKPEIFKLQGRKLKKKLQVKNRKWHILRRGKALLTHLNKWFSHRTRFFLFVILLYKCGAFLFVVLCNVVWFIIFVRSIVFFVVFNWFILKDWLFNKWFRR